MDATTLLILLIVVLACPLVMWFMMRNQGKDADSGKNGRHDEPR